MVENKDLENKLFSNLGAEVAVLHKELLEKLSLLDYFEKLQADARPARTAPQRICDMIDEAGVTPVDGAYEKFKRYEFFTPMDANGNPKEEALFGLEKPLMKLVGKLRNAAHRRGAEKRIILMHGPVGSAKTTIANLFKAGLERYSRSNPIYTIEWVNLGEEEFGGKRLHDMVCPLNEDPLKLIPEGRDREAVMVAINRDNFLKTGSPMKYPVKIVGGLCPQCNFNLEALMREYDGDWQKAMDRHVKVVRWLMSEKSGKGIGTFQPKDEKNQDSTELTGNINFRLIAKYGSDSDPRAFNFDGEFCKANRGVVEFIEMLKLEVAFLYDLLEASQSKQIKPKKFAKTDIDLVILGHTNNPEFEKLKNNKYMEALRDRTVKIDIPYNLRLEEEVKVYRKGFIGEAKHIAPHTFEAAAIWALLTRLEEPKQAKGGTLTLMQKLRLYDGQKIDKVTADVVRKMMNEAEKEGLVGISPRVLQDALGDAASMYDEPCINPFMVLTMLEDKIKHSFVIEKEETRQEYLSLIDMAKSELTIMIKNDIAKAKCGNEMVEKYAKKYIDNVTAWCDGEMVAVPEDPLRKMPPDKRFMQAVEKRAGITEAQSPEHRKNLVNLIGTMHYRGKEFSIADDDQIRRAIEDMIFDDNKNAFNVHDYIAGVLDNLAQGKKDKFYGEMMKQGYCEHCVNNVLRHAQSKLGEAAEDNN